jgi:tRNA modification GTPase
LKSKAPGTGLLFSKGEWALCEDTIAAISTPRGTGGISIVRLSGPDAVSIADRVVNLKTSQPIKAMQSWSARLGTVRAADGTAIDEAVVILMRKPRSYTGEDMVELQCHGGPVASQKVLFALLEAGARHAGPGEFTKRAFLSGRITLDEAEAVLDVVTASTEAALKEAGRRLGGELGAKVKKWEERLYGALAGLLALADFPEEVEEMSESAFEEIAVIRKEIADVLRRAPLGLALSGGIEVCLVGAPNSGKSSLFNALLSQDRAIVTEVPGTTRDVLRERAEWNGLPVILLDTAGLRRTEDVVELIGVARAEEAARESEVILYVIDGTRGVTCEDRKWVSKWREEGRHVIAVVSKADAGIDPTDFFELGEITGGAYVVSSSKTGQGVEEIKARVARMFDGGDGLEVVAPGSARQVDCLRRAEALLGEALSGRSSGWSEDVLVLSVEEAARALSELTGKNVSEEALEQVFSRFCVGK